MVERHQFQSVLHRRVQRIGGGVHGDLGQAQTLRRLTQDLVTPLVNKSIQLVVGNDLVHEAHALGLIGVVLAHEKEDFAGLLLADNRRHELASPPQRG